MSSRTITLFTDPPPSKRGPSGFLVSILLHCIGIGLFLLGLNHTPRIAEPPARWYTVRLLNLSKPEPQMRRSAEQGAAHPAPQGAARAAASGGRPALPSAPQQLAKAVPAPQTLVQPDLPPNLLLPKETPIPLVVLWSPESDPARKIVLPPPQEATVAEVQPSLDLPNHELDLADIKVAASKFVTELPTLPPSTTSPVTVPGSQPVEQVPETSSNPVGPPVPARVISLSDIQLQQGTIALPLVNEVAQSAFSGSLAAGRPGGLSQAGTGNAIDKQNGTGTGQGSGDGGATAAAQGGPAGQSGANAGSSQKSGQQPGASSGSGSEPATARITRSKDGQFGVVVVGSSLADEYPEALGTWSARLAYTVYVHVGLTKSWILQYSLPRAAEAAAAGSVTRLDAPWPYVIVRPRLAPGDSDADAILVHGFVNTAGHFEQLAVVFPPKFAQTEFVLRALREWQFRPATRNGQAAAVEVLLIIPDQPEEPE